MQQLSSRTRALALALSLLWFPATAINNGLGKTPPAGFRTWNRFGLSVSQALMERVMHAMVAPLTINGSTTSLKDLLYNDVGLDDGWQKCQPTGGYHNLTTGRSIIDTAKFPNMTAMVELAHSLNLTASWYGNNCNCASSLKTDCPDIVKCVQGDVAAFREFNYDGYKLDSCGNLQDIALWSSMLTATGRPVLLENCHNGPWDPEPARKPNSDPWCPFNTWRTSTDSYVHYGILMGMNLQTTLKDTALSMPGCWNFPDMLEVGVPPGLHPGEKALTFNEARSHFGAWCIVSSPLVLGLDVTNTTLLMEYAPIIANVEAIEVNQQWAGHSGTLLLRSPDNVTWSPCGIWPTCSAGAWEVWWKPLPNDAVALLFLNHSPGPSASLALSLATVPGLSCGRNATDKACDVRDMWQHADWASPVRVNVSVGPIDSHDSVFLRLSPAPAT